MACNFQYGRLHRTVNAPYLSVHVCMCCTPFVVSLRVNFCGSHHTSLAQPPSFSGPNMKVARIIPRLQSRGTRNSRTLIAGRLIVEAAVKFTAQDLKRMLNSVVQSNW